MKLNCKKKEGSRRRQDKDNLKNLGRKQKRKRWLEFLKRKDLLPWKVQKNTVEIFIVSNKLILLNFYF